MYKNIFLNVSSYAYALLLFSFQLAVSAHRHPYFKCMNQSTLTRRCLVEGLLGFFFPVWSIFNILLPTTLWGGTIFVLFYKLDVDLALLTIVSPCFYDCYIKSVEDAMMLITIKLCSYNSTAENCI